MCKKNFLFFLFFFFSLTAFNQNEDFMQCDDNDYNMGFIKNKSHPNDTIHSPKKAAIFSAVLPGLGQAYNKKYWKMPIVYAGLGVSGWFIYNNHSNYKLHKKEYVYRLNNNFQPENEELSGYSPDQLRVLLDQYHRWRDFSIAAAAVVYTLNIIDALVDGYLWRFDADDKDLSLRIGITTDYTFSFYPVLKLRYNFANSFIKKKNEYSFIRLR